MTMEKKTISYEGGGLKYTLALHRDGVSVCGLRDRVAGKNWFSGERDLFELTARRCSNGETLTALSSTGWKSVTATDRAVILSGHNLLGSVTVIMTATPTADQLLLDIELLNAEKDISLQKCDYPSLYFDKNRNIRFFYPLGPGETKSCLWPNWHRVQEYPSFAASMQYLAFWNEKTRRGVYYGCHDPAPASKRLISRGKEGENDFCIKANQTLTGITSGCNSQKMAGSICLRAFDGDWYDATLFYREFVETQAQYRAPYDGTSRIGVPDWMKETDCWFNTRVTVEDESFADEIIEQAKVLGVNPSVHLYYWHAIPYDNDYPHYFPMKPNVPGGVKKLQAAGIKVMPYINGRLWDTRDRGCEDFEFTSVAKPNCTKGLDGQPITETYESKESDGSKVTLAVMCPSTTLWQDRIAGLVEQLQAAGFDGVYIDQIAAAEAKACTDPSHKHPAGGGEWWCRAYNTMLERVCRTKRADFGLTTECTADPFMAHLDAYLTWVWIKNEQVPAFSTVYSDKVLTFGTDFRGLGNMNYSLFGEIDGGGVRIFSAQSFLFGQQMGWMTPALFARLPHQDFFVKLVRSRAKFRDYFLAGRPLRPPFIQDDGEKIVVTKCREAYGGYVESPCVCGMLWRKNADGRRALLLTNSDVEERTATVKCELEDGNYTLQGDVSCQVTIKDGTFTAKLPALSLCYIEI